MEAEKRKREDDGEAGGKRGNGGVKTEEPGDDEVEEFFAIMRRMHVAVRYFKERDRRKLLAAPSDASSLSFRSEDFGAVEKQRERNLNNDLDLNSDPVTDHEADTGPKSLRV